MERHIARQLWDCPAVLQEVTCILKVVDKISLIVDPIGRNRGAEVLKRPVRWGLGERQLVKKNMWRSHWESLKKAGTRVVHILKSSRGKQNISWRRTAEIADKLQLCRVLPLRYFLASSDQVRHFNDDPASAGR